MRLIRLTHVCMTSPRYSQTRQVRVPGLSRLCKSLQKNGRQFLNALPVEQECAAPELARMRHDIEDGPVRELHDQLAARTKRACSQIGLGDAWQSCLLGLQVHFRGEIPGGIG